MRKPLIISASILAGLILLAVVLLALLPTATKWLINDWIDEQGLSGQVDALSFNLFTGDVHLSSLAFADSKQRRFRIDELKLNIDMSELRKKQLTFERVRLSGFHLDIVKEADGSMSWGGVTSSHAPELEQESEPDASLASAASDNKSVTGNEAGFWPVTIKDIAIKNAKTCYLTEGGDVDAQQHQCVDLGSLAFARHSFITIRRQAQPLGMQSETHNETQPEAQNEIQFETLIEARIDAVIRSLRYYDKINNREIFNAGSIHVEKLEMLDLDSLKAASLSGSDVLLHIGEVDSYLFSARQLDLEESSILQWRHYRFDAIRAQGLQGDISHMLKPAIAGEDVGDIKSETAPAVETEAKPESDYSWVVTQLTIGEDSSIRYRDNTVEPEYQGQFYNIEFTATDIDSTTDSPSQVQLEMQYGEHARLTLSGNMTFFSERPTADLQSKIRSLDLASLSAYSKKILQHRINSGQMDADITFKAKQGVLDAHFNVDLYKFYVERLADEEAARYGQKPTPMLSPALSLLREKDDHISLKVPMTGDISDPKFSLSNMINKVTLDAVQSAVVLYYSPLGILTTAKSAYDFITALRFSSISFLPGQYDLDKQDKAALKKLVDILDENPKRRLGMCGHATLSDRLALFPDDKLRTLVNKAERGAKTQEPEVNLDKELPALKPQQMAQLQALAKLRQEAVKAYLIENEVSPERLILCNPLFTNNDTKKPRVEFLF